MDPEIQDAMNAQIQAELYSAYVYLAMSAHFAEENFDGFSRWMRLQAQEELDHAMRFYEYLLERGAHVELRAVDAPEAEFGPPVELFRRSLDHEKKITGMIHELFHLAREKNDYASEQMLQWFINEQVEEEDSVGRAVQQLEMAGDNTSALLMLDHRFGERGGEGHGHGHGHH